MCVVYVCVLPGSFHFIHFIISKKIPELLKHCKAYRNDFCKIKSTKNLSEPQGLRPIWRLFSFCFLLFTFWHFLHFDVSCLFVICILFCKHRKRRIESSQTCALFLNAHHFRNSYSCLIIISLYNSIEISSNGIF